ncbi:ATP/GTP-binding protein [Siphonobacter sp. BAB-5385]|uniref:AAA family ATPase n=1 Tax=Siphonobacter sp. BAB-5385 TaxID=1864822 RepID=UPI001595FA3A|nr:AAA family ATPase [Siphonobacter sp. BAB-5385]
MLHSLEIKNYRNLRHLTIPKLGRVNLVIGKNNTGKSSLLEAVAILNTNDIWKTLYAILGDRGEVIDSKDIEYRKRIEEVFSSLIYNSIIDQWNENNHIQIIDLGSKVTLGFVFGIIGLNNSFFTLVKNKSELEGKGFQGIRILKYKRTGEDNNYHHSGGNLGGENLLTSITTDNFKYVSPSLLTKINSQLWDLIALTDEKKSVIKALHLIDSNIVDLDFNSADEAFIRHKNLGKLPLKRMGDGINRILTIILKMVTCTNGYLLIDEFENGLHYSVQEKLWEIIFQLAEKLNVQVFATTHSNDTIKAFESIVNSQDQYQNSQLIKLVNIDGEIKQETADAEDLEIIVENNIDPR